MSETYLSSEQIQAGLAQVLASPHDEGPVVAIVVRPAEDEREVRRAARLSPEGGVEGDRWASAGGPDLEQQVSMMNARLLRLLAGDEERMRLAGDNLVIDLDLGEENLPPGQKLKVGGVLLEVTDAPHTGCGKFAARFVNAAGRRDLHLRGRYARVLQAGAVRVGDIVQKVD